MEEESKMKRVARMRNLKNSGKLEDLPLDELVTIFYEKVQQQLDDLSPIEIWLRFIENAGTRIAEFIRREEYMEAIKSLGEAFGWLCCFVKKCYEHYEIDILSDIAWNKYPGMCYACADKIAEDDAIKKNPSPCICPGMNWKPKNLRKREIRLRHARKSKNRPKTLDDWAEMIKSIYKEVHSILPISAICLHFIEEVGEVTRELCNYDATDDPSKKNHTVKNLEKEIADVFSWILGLINKIDQLFDKTRSYYKEETSLLPLKASKIASETARKFPERT